LDENENVKIGDFGLATTLRAVMRKAPSSNVLMETCHFTDKSFDLEEEEDSEMSKSSENVGTFFYTSPEGCRGPKCDIYSLGIILFEVSYSIEKINGSNCLTHVAML
jgi:serine/threonine protein kinase